MLLFCLSLLSSSYKDRSGPPEHAAVPDFLMLWLFVVSCPILLIVSFINIFWDHAVSRLLVRLKINVSERMLAT